VDTIAAPPFPRGPAWLNSPPLRMEEQIGRPVLVEFWDFCRVNSLRTLPYVREWQRRYADAGLRVIGIHASGFPPSADEAAIREAVARLEVRYPVVVDSELEIWRRYGNRGWPARYLWDSRGRLHDYHYGEGAYADTERAIQELVGDDREPVPPRRPEDDPRAMLAAQTADQPDAYRGPYAAGEVWAVLDGRGAVQVDGRWLEVDHPGCYPLAQHPRHTEATLDLRVGDGVNCHAVCFTPGVVDQAEAA
jgi:thiol-disulfide isomerase/thioredoxin